MSKQSSAQAAVEDSDRIFTEMIRSIEKRRSEVTELIRDQERAEMNRAEELMEKLEQEIAELKKRDAELEQLSHTDNHICFLQVLSLLRYDALSQKRFVYLCSSVKSHCWDRITCQSKRQFPIQVLFGNEVNIIEKKM